MEGPVQRVLPVGGDSEAVKRRTTGRGHHLPPVEVVRGAEVPAAGTAGLRQSAGGSVDA